jgi:hypothetical protein
MNDMFPEEQDPEFEELIALLRHVDLDPPLIDPKEWEKIISQARARLFPTDPEVSQPGDEVRPPNEREDVQHRNKRLAHLVNMLAAVLVVAALIVSSQLIFGPWSPLQRDHVGTAPPIGPVGAPVKIYTGTFSGLDMSLQITPGPYFLGEVLEVDLSIANHSHIPNVFLQPLDPSGCPNLLRVVTTGGGSPYSTDIQRNWTAIDSVSFLNCNLPPFGSQQGYTVLTSQTITITQYIQLTSSIHVTFTARVGFHMWRYDASVRLSPWKGLPTSP